MWGFFSLTYEWETMEMEIKDLSILKYVDDIIKYCEMQFPKKCNCCEYVYKDFKDFLDNTYIPKHAVKCNIQIIDFYDLHNIISYRNCKCGTTVVLPCVIEDKTKLFLLNTINYDSRVVGISKEDILIILRDKIIKKMENKNLTKEITVL